MNDRYFAALLGFAFAAAWAGLGFAEAILCLAGAAAFYAVARFMEGDLDVGDVRERVEGARSGFRHGHRTQSSPPPVAPGPPPAPGAPPRPTGGGPRVR